MSIDYSKISFSSQAVALKLIKEGSGSGTIPATSGGGSDEYQTVTIPHGQSTDELIFRVVVSIPGYPVYNEFFVVPFAVSGLFATPSIDSTNLYIEVGQSGFGLPSQVFQYYYRILIP
jgi:hypothetical protein